MEYWCWAEGSRWSGFASHMNDEGSCRKVSSCLLMKTVSKGSLSYEKLGG